jgi:D-apiose dehydrogenase
MTPQHRIGIVGTGWVAHQHLAGLRSVVGDRAVVTAACDPHRDVLAEFADRYAIPQRFPDVATMVRSGEVDVLLVLTPPAIRDEVVDPALAAGVHLLIEKPFAESAARAAGYVEAAEQAGVHLAVGQNFRWFPEHQWMKRQLDDGRLGALQYLEARSFQDRPQGPGVWRAAESRLEMAIFSIHLIDRLQWMAVAAPRAVSAVTRRDESTDLPGEQLTSLLVQFDGGLVGHLTSTWMSKALPVNDMRADGERGSVAVERPGPMAGDASGRVALRGEQATVERFPDPAEDPHAPRSYGHSLLAFLEAVDAGRDAPHSGRDNLRTMGIMDAAYASAARGGELVEVTEVLGGHRLEATVRR